MDKLKPREKRTIIVGGVLLAFLLASWFLFLGESSLWEQYRILKTRVAARQEVYRKMVRLNRKYRIIRKRANDIISRLGSRPEGWTVEGFLENTVQEQAPGAVLKRMKPRSETVHNLYRESSAWVSLGKIALPELVDFLYGVEYSESPLQIRELKIEDEKKFPGLLEVELTVVTAQPLKTPVEVKKKEKPRPSPPPSTETKQKKPKPNSVAKKSSKNLKDPADKKIKEKNK